MTRVAFFAFRGSATLIHDACASRDLEFNGVNVAAHLAQALSALGFAYARPQSTDKYIRAGRSAA